MTWSLYSTYLIFVVLIVIAPGPDTMVVLKNSLADGARGGVITMTGITVANLCQATAVAIGLGALIVQSQPVFTALRWAGVAYLCYLGAQALRGAWRGDYQSMDEARARHGGGFRRAREGFLSNVTNPKVLAFYLSVLPQFLDPATTTIGDALLLGYTVAVLGAAWLLLLLLFVHRVRLWLRGRKVRRWMDGITGTALVGFGAALAVEG